MTIQEFMIAAKLANRTVREFRMLYCLLAETACTKDEIEKITNDFLCARASRLNFMLRVQESNFERLRAAFEAVQPDVIDDALAKGLIRPSPTIQGEYELMFRPRDKRFS